jgi:glycosyltransferase involved in cell wall biosynthesis
MCCYNSARRLPETLKHLARQKVPQHIQWELVLVNNNSEDVTVELASSEWSKYRTTTPFRLVDELQPGLSNARVRGIKESRFDYLIFCDDDNWLSEDYVFTAYKLLASDPCIAAAGGISKAVFETEKPEWFDMFQGYFAVGPQSDLPYKVLRGYNYLYGACIVLRKSVFETLTSKQFYFFLADRTGKSLKAGGDVELCLALRLLDLKVVYTTDLQFCHFMPAERLNLSYLRKLVLSCPPTWIVFNAYHFFLTKKQVSPETFYKQVISETKRYLLTNCKAYLKSIVKGRTTRRITYEAKLLYLINLVVKKNVYDKCIAHLSIVFN